MQQFYTDTKTVATLLSRRRRPIPETGTKFRGLTFTGIFGWSPYPSKRDHNRIQLMCQCVCKCGKVKAIAISSLDNLACGSCGCDIGPASAVATRLRRKFPPHNPKIRTVWSNMNRRCSNPTDIGFKNYGAKGVSVCQEWKTDFWSFHEWAIDSGYSDGLTLDRKDVKGNYSPDNCQWITPSQQARNKRNTVLYEGWGEFKAIADWAEDQRCTVDYHLLWRRVCRGRIPLEIAATMNGRLIASRFGL